MSTLIIVSGAPGSGKTTLARLLADQMRLPLISRDDLKETLLDTLGAPDRAASQALGRASFALLLLVAERLSASSSASGLIIESNFRRGSSEADLRPLVARTAAILIHCQTQPDEIVRRYRERRERGERHAGHFDQEATADLIRDLDAGLYAPLDLTIPLLTVDTTNGYKPSLSEILRATRGAVAS